MKIKEIKKTVSLSWSPKSQYPMYLAAGTAAHIDASFNTSAAVELYRVNLNDPSPNLEVQCAFKSDNRFHELIWSNDVIVGGCDDGKISIYNAVKLLNNENVNYEKPPENDELIAYLDKHKGPVRALDFNIFQTNLLATGASESEFFIWDLNYEALTPMSIRAPDQLIDNDITSLSWNKQVAHIIATSFSSRCLVWDLRKNEPIIKLTDSSSKIRWKNVKWNWENATQLCLASEDDHYPVIQMWDLRSPTSPTKTLEGHQRGVLSLAYGRDDPDLLISCGKDNKVLVWNVNTASPTGEIIREISVGTQGNFEVSWCPRNPFLIASSSYDGGASIYSLASDGPSNQNAVLADSFPGMNQYSQSAPQQVNFGKPWKWLKKPAGVSFAFGGKLVSFGNKEKTVYVHQVVTESELDLKFKELESVLDQGNVYAHCLKKAELSTDPGIKNVWNFIASQFYGDNFKNQMYVLLGTSQPSLQDKLSSLNISDESLTKSDQSNDPYSNASRIGPADGEDIFGLIAAQQNSTTETLSPVKEPLKIIQSNDMEGAICDALLLGNIELAVDLCLREGRMTDAIVLAMSGGPELIAKAQSKYFEIAENHITTLISAVVTEDWQNIIEICDLSNWKQVLVALITYTRNDEFRFLCELLGQRLSAEGDDSLKKDALICYICAGDVNKLIENWKPQRTYSASEIQEFAELGLLMREAAKARGIDLSVTGPMANVLLQYAELLTSQGYLKEAYSYLGESQEGEIEVLKDRLMFALGLKTFKPEVPQAKTGYFKPQTTNYGAQYSNLNGYSNLPKTAVKPFTNVPTVAPVPTQHLPSMPTMPPMPSMPSLPSMNAAPSIPPMPPAPMSTIQPIAPMSRATPTPPPPPPSSQLPYSNARQTPDHLAQGRTKYVLDPSVQGGMGHRNSFSTGTFPTMPGVVQPLVNQVPPFTAQNEPPAFYPAVSQPQTNSFALNPPNVTQFVPQTSMQSDIPKIMPLPYPNAAWNDPPVLMHDKPAPNKISYVSPRVPQTSQAPTLHSNMPNTSQIGISSPGIPGSQMGMFNPGIPNPTPGMLSNNQMSHMTPGLSNSNQGHMNSIMPSNNQIGQMNQGIPNINPISQLNPVIPNSNPIGVPNIQPIGSLNSAIPNSNPSSFSSPNPMAVFNPSLPNSHPTGLPPTSADRIVKPKAALPEEHIHLQTVFEELRNQCYMKTANAQMKRKLDDVARKLEMLFDAVRESKLSPATLQGLHQIVNAIQKGNYPECLSVHSQLVAGPDFSNIASFMPGIKVLVQSALQLEVYL